MKIGKPSGKLHELSLKDLKVELAFWIKILMTSLMDDSVTRICHSVE